MTHTMHRTAALAALVMISCAALAPAAALAAATAVAAKPDAKKAAPAAGVTDAAIAAIDAQIAKAKIDKTNPNWKTMLAAPTQVKFDPARKYLMHMVTSKGPLTIEMKPKVAPMHVTSFIYLTRMGFFDGLKFHRVMKAFMAQGGDPLGNGAGTPGYQIGLEVSPSVKHDKPGVCSTANTGAPNTDGSQFFIMFRPYPSLDGKYSIWGQVTEGFDVLKALEAAANPGDGPPTQNLSINKVTIEVK